MPDFSKAFLPLRSITSTRLKNSARFIIAKLPTVLAPSFLQQRNGDGSSNPKVPPTAWLDGMRGIAAFLVYIRHFGAIHHPNIQAGFGSSESNTYITQLPFIRLLVSGPAMVALFFIISGYALSWGPLRTIHAGSVDKSFERLSSATFRRGMRLYLPGVISTFIIMICISLGMYNRGQKAFESDVDIPGFHEPQPPMWLKDPFSVQFWDWIRCSWAWVNIWHSTGHAYNPHLWTLSVEFRSSIALFMALLALARTRAVYRLAGLTSFVVYCYYTDAWAEWLFFAGATLAQLKLLQDQYESALLGDIKLEEDDSDNGCSTSLSTLDIVRVVIFVAGLYLLSAPDNGLASEAPGYIFLSTTLIPASWPENWRFLHCLGGLFTIYAVSSTSTHMLRAIFDNTYSRYLGKISYSLYLVHGPVVHMLGSWLVPWFWQFTGRDNMFSKELGWGIAFIFQTALIIWIADIFWRLVDMNCVAFAKWCEEQVKEK